MGLFSKKKPQQKKRPTAQKKQTGAQSIKKPQSTQQKKRVTLEAELVSASGNRPKSAPSKRPAKSQKAAPKRPEAAPKRPAKAQKAAPKRPQQRPQPVKARPNTSSAKKPDASRVVKKPAARRSATPKKVNNPSAINSKIKTQNPKVRSAVQMGKRVNGGVQNFEINRRPKQESHKFYIKKKKQPIKVRIHKRMSAFLVMFIILFGVVALCFALSLNSSASSKGYSLQIGKKIDEDDKTTEITLTEIPKEAAYRNGVRYVPMYLLSDYCELSVTGTTELLKYSSRNVSGQSIRFNVNSIIAYVNGQKVLMNAPAFIYDSKLYVPEEFLKTYSIGISFEENEEENILIVTKLLTGTNSETKENIYSELSFKLSPLNVCPSIAEPEDTDSKKSSSYYDDDDYDYDYDYYYDD